MGRDAIKACQNIWYQKRIEAAKYNDKLSSREGAAEVLGMSVSSLADTELGLQKTMPVDKAVRMADEYHAPELLNYYCMNECPIGCRQSISDSVIDIDRLTVKVLATIRLDQLSDIKNRLLDIAADGVISKDEMEKFIQIDKELSDYSRILSEIHILSESLKNGRYYDERREEAS